MFAEQLDFIAFFYGASFILLGLVCLALFRPSPDRPCLSWLGMGLFGIVHGVHEWLDMVALCLGDTPSFRLARLVVLFLSFVFLLEFVRSGWERFFGIRCPRWLYGFLLPVASLGFLGGTATAEIVIRYTLGLGGALGAAALLSHLSQRRDLTSFFCAYFLRVAAAALILYGLAAGLIVPPADFMPARVLNADVFLSAVGIPISFFRGLLGFLLAASIAFFAIWQNLRSVLFLRRHRRRAVFFLLFAIVSLTLFFFLVYRVVLFHSQRARLDEARARLLKTQLFAQVVDRTIDRLRGIEAMARHPQLADALAQPVLSAPDRAIINERLDRYRNALRADVCYLMDRTGLTVASSNRDSPKSFLGENYSFRPYFQRALEGEPAVYLAKGVTSGERGFYLSFPVVRAADPSGFVLGVAVAKGRLDNLSLQFRSRPYVFLLSPEGVIFVSSRPDWVFRTIRPLSETQKETLRSSRQFGSGPWEAVGFDDLDAIRSTLTIRGQRYSFARIPVPSLPGWTLLFVDVATQIPTVRFLIILIFLGFFLILSIIIVFLFRLWLDAVQISSAEVLYEGLVEGIKDGIEFYDHSGRCLSVNSAGLAMMDRRREEVLGSDLLGQWPTGSREKLRGVLARVTQTGKPQVFEAEVPRPGGGQMVKAVTIIPLRVTAAAPFFIVHSRDVTMERHSQQQLLQRSKMSTVGALATGVAHEFNNVLEVILGRAELAHASADLRAKTDALQAIIDIARRGSWVAKSLLDFSGSKADKRGLVDLKDVIKQVLILLETMLKEGHIEVVTQLREAPRVACNAAQMAQAFSNIIVNARDAMGGLPERRLTITLDSDLSTKIVRVCFLDTGPGIREDMQDRIFDPFITSKGILGGGDDRAPGMGLGLFVAYGIVKHHGGDITVTSQPGKGACFCVTLPMFTQRGSG